MTLKRDHGGGLDRAISQFGGTRRDWLDLSTGINPNSYPIPDIPAYYWQVLPDEAAKSKLLNAARAAWNVPKGAEIVAASGVSAIIAQLPDLVNESCVDIPNPTYNEFAAAFEARNWLLKNAAPVQVRVHPNNPDGTLFSQQEVIKTHDTLTIIDESFCDVCPEKSLVALAETPGYIILKGTGKFWGLAGLRLGFAITSAEIAEKLTQRLGPWHVSGPAQYIGQMALTDRAWCETTRQNLASMTSHLKDVLSKNGLTPLGGTDLFQLASTPSAKSLHNHLCENKILTRIFPYSKKWIRLGLPANAVELNRLNNALEGYL